MEVSLWDEIRVGGLRLRNRSVMPAMATVYTSVEGRVTDRLKAYLRKRAEGGVGLIVTEACAVHPAGKGFRAELSAYDDSFLPGLEGLAEDVRSAGSAIALQLHHGGRETLSQVIGQQPVAPSPIPSPLMRQEPRELTREEIAELVGCYAAAARRARDAGFDAVEVHGAHGYLIHQFISPLSNRREDEYGGDAEGRFRFAREIVREIKREAGKDFPVLFRFSSKEAVKDGYELDYILPLLVLLEDDGVDAFHVSVGAGNSPGLPICPNMHYPPGINVERASKVKEKVKVPVIVVGKIHDPRLAEQVLSEGKADMIAFGRQHLADAMFLSKAAEGRYEDIRFCLSCNQGCIERFALELQPITCVINPECGEELTERKGAVRLGPFLVAGAGPAGLQAAITLKEAGAEIRVVEREEAPGGQIRAASKPEGKEPYADWVNWAVRRLESLGTNIELGKEAGEEILGERDWAGVIAATGASPIVPDLPGSELDIDAEAREVLLGLRDTGERVLIVGAGSVGLETAEFLIQKGRKVTVVEERDFSPVLALASHGYFLHRELNENGELLLSTRLLEVTDEGARVSTHGEERVIEVDTVVWAVGSRPEREFLEASKRAGIETMEAGDVIEPRRLLEAVHEGARTAAKLLYGD